MNTHFKQETGVISLEKTWTWLQKRNLKRETEYLVIAQNNPREDQFCFSENQYRILLVGCIVIGKLIIHMKEWSKLVQKDHITRLYWWGK